MVLMAAAISVKKQISRDVQRVNMHKPPPQRLITACVCACCNSINGVLQNKCSLRTTAYSTIDIAIVIRSLCWYGQLVASIPPMPRWGTISFLCDPLDPFMKCSIFDRWPPTAECSGITLALFDVKKQLESNIYSSGREKNSLQCIVQQVGCRYLVRF